MSENSATKASNTLLDELQVRFQPWVHLASEHLKFRSKEWALRTQLEVAASNPFASHEQVWEDFATKLEEGVLAENEWRDATRCFGELCQVTGKPFDKDFWHKQWSDETSGRKNLKKDKRESRPHLQKAAELLGKHWRETLDRAISEWEIREIAKHRNALRDEL